MTINIGNAALQQSTTTGTSTLDLDAVSAGSIHQSLADALGLTSAGQTAKTSYFIASEGIGWEVGVGVVTKGTPDTLSRDTLTESATGAFLNLDSGPHKVGIALDAAALQSLADADSQNGFVAQTSSKFYARRTLTPGQDIGITNQAGTNGDPTISMNNTLTANKTITIDGGNAQFTVSSASDDSAETSVVVLRASEGTHASRSAVTNGKVLGRFRWEGWDSAALQLAAFFRGVADSNWTTGTQPTRLEMGVNTTTAMTVAADGGIFTNGATGGTQGLGTINATGVYDDGSLLTCYPLEAEIDGRIDLTRWDKVVPDRVYAEERNDEGELVKPERRVTRTHERARKFERWQLDPEQYHTYWKTNYHLPGLPSPNDFTRYQIGETENMLKETLDVFAVHGARYLDRIKTLEQENQALRDQLAALDARVAALESA